MVYILTAIRNRKDLTLEFLAAVKKQTYKDYKIIVVDDGSTDGSSDEIKAKYPQVEIISGNGNLWWTGAVNVGLEHIINLAEKRDFILIINDDTVFDGDYLKTIIETSIANRRSIVGSICKDYYNRSKIIRTGIKISWGPYKREQTLLGPDTLSTRGTLVPVEVFNKVGLLDRKNFPHYTSDYDFFYRAKKAGYNLILSNDVIVYSRGGRANFTLREKLFSKKSAGNLSNELRFIWKHGPTIFGKVIDSGRYLGATIKQIIGGK